MDSAWHLGRPDMQYQEHIVLDMQQESAPSKMGSPQSF